MGAFDDIIEKFGGSLGRMAEADLQGQAVTAFLQSVPSNQQSRGQRLNITNPPPYDPRFTVNDPNSGVNIGPNIPSPVKSAMRIFNDIGVTRDIGLGPTEMAAPAAMVVSKATLPNFIEGFMRNIRRMREEWPDIPPNLQDALAFMYTKNPTLMGRGQVVPEIPVEQAYASKGLLGYFNPLNQRVVVVAKPQGPKEYVDTLGHELTHRVNWHRHPEYAQEAVPLRRAAINAWDQADEYTYRTDKPIFPDSAEDRAIRAAEDAVWNSRDETYARGGGETARRALNRFFNLQRIEEPRVEEPSVFPPPVR